MAFVERFIVRAASYVLPERAAYRLARAVLATQGIGWAAPADGVKGSGEASFLKKILATTREPCVFDVGANVGEYARAALAANPDTTLHCFEPSVPHFRLLQDALSRTKAKLNLLGLSDAEGPQPLHKDAEVTGLASLIPRDLAHLDIRLHAVENVQLVTGDSYVSQHQISRIDLLKIDVEGWEMSVLRGFQESFGRKIIRCCQFEFGHAHIEKRENFRDFYRFFIAKGFRIGPLKPNGRVKYIARYDEIFENYYATNYVASLLGTQEPQAASR